ncbi:hypothetical protein lbkm_2617 [Lachnospiraceae bacterium KM106-2]|nr:hypothetical protein lbkm_2617 [Lachnospiraceae bacterium KM106-2]
MFEESYEKLAMDEKNQFRQMVNWLLAHTYLVQNTYTSDGTIDVADDDYVFVERNFELFSDYFSFSGFVIDRDSNYGVISLQSQYDYNRARFDKLTTQILYTIRLIYEEQREHVTLVKDIITTVGDIIHKMLTLGIIKKKPADRDLHKALAVLAKFQVVSKLEGKWEDAETRCIIMPTILFIISNEKISSLYNLIGEDNEETMEDEE